MRRAILLLLILSCLMSFVSCADQPVPDKSTETDLPTETEESSSETEPLETETVDLTPVTVDADEGAYTAYVLPYEEDFSEEDQDALKKRMYADGKIHYLMEHIDTSNNLVVDRVFTFDGFFELEHGTFERPYLFETGLPLKIMTATTQEPFICYCEAYVPSPAVFGAFRDLILPLPFTDTEDSLHQKTWSDTFVTFRYDDKDYYIFETGEVFCDKLKSETNLSAEATALFLAYKFAFIYASVLGGGHYISFELGYSIDADFVVAIRENGAIRYLEGDEARDFVRYHSIKNEFHPEDGYYIYLQDVNLTDADYGPVLYQFRVCNSKEDDLSNVAWFEFHEGGLITHHGWDKWEMNYEASPRTVQGLVVPQMTAVFTKRFEK